jgi:hypothetical protein
MLDSHYEADFGVGLGHAKFSFLRITDSAIGGGVPSVINYFS